MEDVRKEKIEAIVTANEYGTKLLKGIHNVVEELRVLQKPDTKEYLNTILQGINWMFQVYNATKDIINETSVEINKDEVNKGALALNDAIKINDNETIANVLEQTIAPFLVNIQNAAKKLA